MPADWRQAKDQRLKEFCTDKQAEMLDSVVRHKGFNKAARADGVASGMYARAFKSVLKKAAAEGYTQNFDATRFVDPGQNIIGKSTFAKDDEGNPVWIKTKKADEQEDVFRDRVAELCSQIKPYPKIPKPVKTCNSDLLTNYTVTDYHLGMYAWDQESGANWDMDIAEKLLMAKFKEMIDGTPNSHTGILAQLGDFLHWDGMLALTPTAKNVLDADTRFPKLVESATNCLMWCIEEMLRKHKNVHVLMAEGNHDMASSVWLQNMMAKLFRNEKRVTVEQSPYPFYAYQWGKIMLAWHHGHLRKMDDLPGMFASDPRFREMWGKSVLTVIHTGHRHTQRVIEKAGAIVEQHPTIAANDAHSARGFDASWRAAKAITYHKERGEYLRLSVVP